MPSGQYGDLYFTREQLFLSQEEALAVAEEFWGTRSIDAGDLTDRDRAFIQRALLIAVDKSEDASFLFDIWSSFVNASVSRSLRDLVKDLAKRTAERWFNKYIDHDPEISSVGKAAVQYSAYTTQWRLRVAMRDPNQLTSYLVR